MVTETEGSTFEASSQEVDATNFLHTNWNELSDEQRESLVKKYGEPVTVEGSFEIRESERSGSCPANETSLLALDTDRKYWGYYNMGIVNNSMVVWWLEMYPRIMTSKIIKGSDGSMIVPGMIYKEPQSTFDDSQVSIAELLAKDGTKHVAPAGERGDFTTLHLPEKPGNYILTPLRPVQQGEVEARSISGRIDSSTVGNIVNKAQIEAFEDEDEQYKLLRQNISAYFDNPEDPERVVNVRITSPITPAGEIDLPSKEARQMGRIMIPDRKQFQAFLDPVSWNTDGRKVYIINDNEKYYFCPKDNCEVVK